MEKLVIFKGDEVIREFPLTLQKVTIGRDPELDISLNDPSVSRHHGQLLKIFNNYFVEDLKSTNGTMLNSHTITKHILKHGDTIQMGSFSLRYQNSDMEGVEEEDDLDKTVVLQPEVVQSTNRSPRVVTPKTAMVRFFKGPNEGKAEKIERSLYTIGRPGGQVAAIARRPQGFYLLHIGGDAYPKINNKSVDSKAGVQLSEGDVVEVGDNLMEISFGAG
ncbi:MAG: FHA domain-containing protein [Chromatiales bacterium]|nr:FHA domain-containing protein [Chromatiales bacterium]